MGQPFNPFAHEGPKNVLLERAPLVRVVVQVRFPPIVSLGRAEFIGPFQEALRPQYPILREQQVGIFLSPVGVHGTGGNIWRLQDREDAWRISLAQDFVALETTKYVDREDFFRRMAEVLEALENLTNLPVYDRLGVRYINRVRGAELDRLSALVRGEVLGIASTPIAGMAHSICESLFQKDDVTLSTRWGRLPAGVTTDPISIEPIAETSWLLDLDAFRNAQRDFDVAAILRDGRAFARTIHDFFRWCVTDEFLSAYGGTS